MEEQIGWADCLVWRGLFAKLAIEEIESHLPD